MKTKTIKFEDLKIGNIVKDYRSIMVVDEMYVDDDRDIVRGRMIATDAGGFFRIAKPRGKRNEIPIDRISSPIGSYISLVSESLEKLMSGNSNSKQEEIDRLKKKIKIIEDRIKNIEEVK